MYSRLRKNGTFHNWKTKIFIVVLKIVKRKNEKFRACERKFNNNINKFKIIYLFYFNKFNYLQDINLHFKCIQTLDALAVTIHEFNSFKSYIWIS